MCSTLTSQSRHEPTSLKSAWYHVVDRPLLSLVGLDPFRQLSPSAPRCARDDLFYDSFVVSQTSTP